MAQLTLRTLLAYIDDTLEPAPARQLGLKVAESELARDLIDRIKKVTRRRGLQSPISTGTDGEVSDPNTVAEYLSDTLDADQVTRLEQTCLESDVHLAEVAACHQILTIILTEPVRVPPRARQRMYGLVPPPASVANRKPGKTLPIGGVGPREVASPDRDDDDANLLLGLGRYGGGSVGGRLGLAAAAVGLAAFLAVAVVMALPHKSPPPPETAAGYVAASPTAPAPAVPPAPAGPVTPVPPPDGGKPPAPEPPPAPVTPPPKPPEKDPTPAPPRADRVVLGKVEGVNAIVLTRPEDGPAWVRLDPAGDAVVRGGDPVLCLPGFKADVQLDTGVKVRLWGNVPELLPDRLLEARVRFHAPEPKADGKGGLVDADITLAAGRIYLSTTRAAGGKVRLRFQKEVWDLTLADDKTDVLVQLVTAFEPGVPYVRDAGAVQTEARLAVVRGAASLGARPRGKGFEKVVAPAVVTWDGRSGVPSGPKPIEKESLYYDKFPLVGSDQGKLVQKVLTDMAGRLTDGGGVKVMLAELLTAPPDPGQPLLQPIAVYAQAAIVFGDAAGDELKPLIDLLVDDTRGSLPRVTVVKALAAWLPRAPENSALLEKQVATKVREDGAPAVILRLLRGAVSPAKLDPNELDSLVAYLDHPSVAVRELALWNLVTFADPGAALVPGLVPDVGPRGAGYEKFLEAWRTRVDEIKKRPGPKK